eukprot:2322158-Rhodomonas_salina.1
MSGQSTFKKQLQHKPIGAGIQFWVMAESYALRQDLYNFELDHNDNEPNKKMCSRCLSTHWQQQN